MLLPVGWIIMALAVGTGSAWASGRGNTPTKAIPDVLVYADPDFGSGSSAAYVVIVDKSRQQIKLVGRSDRWKTLAKWPCSTGKQQGPKEREGDQKTPVGIYFATRDVGSAFLSETYGSRALPLDYPNALDRRSARSGSAIWLHGTNKPLQPRESNGCVVLENRTIDELAHYIRLNRTPVIIVERAHLWPEKTARKVAGQVIAAASQWHNAMMKGSYQEFSRYYTPEAKPSMKWWQQWCRFRIGQGSVSGAESVMRRRAIFRADQYYVLLFDQYLKSGEREEWAGCRKLYFNVEEDRFLIFADAFHCSAGRGQDPLFSAWRKLWKNRGQHSRMAVTRNAVRGLDHGDI